MNKTEVVKASPLTMVSLINQILANENTTLRAKLAGEQSAYERLQAAHSQLKGRAAAVESLLSKSEETTRYHWDLIQSLRLEVEQLKHEKSPSEEELGRLRRENFAFETEKLAAEQRVAQLEAQLAAGDMEKQELLAALAVSKADLIVAKLPASSRDNVIQMVREAA